ncbi:disease resistance protein RPV1-like [Rosa chinensis]|uniref:disease resistance protein RPV1-like n=1 Tax=Rosa chinensis TaxID=74649 RepID=UPI000D08C2E1|nr:disease resistance protein RPV1-like [Rosa chinensis]
MHDLLQELGWDIVREQSPNEPGKRSRLWSHEDINNVVKKNMGTDSIQGMVMELTKLQVAHWKPEAFSNLSQLSLLHICNVDLPDGLTCLSNSLRILEWTGYPLRSLPQNFEADELIELNLCHRNIEQLWKGTKNFEKLKFIKLCHSQKIVETPDLAGVQNLETLDLEGCSHLVRIHQSLGFLKKLIVLNLKDCKSLESLPSRIEMESLETLILSNCSKVKKITEFVGNMERLLVLCLDETAIEELPVSIERLSSLVSLNLSNCRNLINVRVMDCFEETDVNSGSAIEMSSTHDRKKKRERSNLSRMQSSLAIFIKVLAFWIGEKSEYRAKEFPLAYITKSEYRAKEFPLAYITKSEYRAKEFPLAYITKSQYRANEFPLAYIWSV